MATYKCENCGAEISDSTAPCPQCGRPVKHGKEKPEPAPWKKTPLIVVVTVFTAYFSLLLTLTWFCVPISWIPALFGLSGALVIRKYLPECYTGVIKRALGVSIFSLVVFIAWLIFITVG